MRLTYVATYPIKSCYRVEVGSAQVEPWGLAGDAADAWGLAVIGQPAHLVYLDDPTRRAIEPVFGTADDRVSFADGYPLLLTNAASLAAVNYWLAESGDEPVEMTRFRPNVVVTGEPAWVEDDWVGKRIRLGAVSFRIVKPCDRRVFITIDPETGVRASSRCGCSVSAADFRVV